MDDMEGVIRRISNSGLVPRQGNTIIPPPEDRDQRKRTWYNWRIFSSKLRDVRYFDLKFNDNGKMKLDICPNKFFRGQNVDLAPLNELKGLFVHLTRWTGIDFFKPYVIIKELDYTYNMQTIESPSVYFNVFGDAKLGSLQFFRHQLETTLYYQNKARGLSFKFYDKGIQARYTKQKYQEAVMIPEKYLNAKLLRFEVKLNKQMALRQALSIGDWCVEEEFREMTPALWMLFDEGRVEALRRFWMECYESIDKQRVKDMTETKGLKLAQTRHELIVRLGAHLPAHFIQQELDLLVNAGVISSKNRSYMKAELREHKKNRRLHPLAEEIDAKIKEFKPLWD